MFSSKAAVTVKVFPDDILDQQQQVQERTVISAYFCGSGIEIRNEYAIANKLFFSTKQSAHQIAMGYTGCSYSHGLFFGYIFGAGTVENARAVADQALSLVKQGKKVTVNCYGFSRGGVSALLVAKMLGHIDESLLEVNLALLDPVPGNLQLTVALDIFGVTLANQVIDLRRSRNLKNVLSFYVTSHGFALTPVIPLYPSHTELQEKTLAGDHNDFEVIFEGLYDAGQGVYSYVHEFMSKHGTQFSNSMSYGDHRWRDYPGLSYAPGTESKKATHSKQNILIVLKKNFHGLIVKNGQRHSEKAQPTLEPNADTILYRNFVTALAHEVKLRYPESKQAEILDFIRKQADLPIAFAKLDMLKNSLRIILALALQRHSTSHDLKSMSDIGCKALELLRKPENGKLAELVLGYSGHKLRYRDLRLFVLGENDDQYFHSRNSVRTFELLKKSEPIAHPFSLAYWLPIENKFVNAANKVVRNKDLFNAIHALKRKAIQELRSGNLAEKQANTLADEVMQLTQSGTYTKMTGINKFESKTAKFARGWNWKIVLGAVIGAAVGIVVGAMVGIWAGPTAAVTALLGGVDGALLGASLMGVGCASLAASIGIWHNRKNDPLRQVIHSAKQLVADNDKLINSAERLGDDQEQLIQQKKVV